MVLLLAVASDFASRFDAHPGKPFELLGGLDADLAEEVTFKL